MVNLLNGNRTLFVSLFCLISFFCSSCGDIFNSRTKIIDSYYLVEGETKEGYTICRQMAEGDFVVRIPALILSYGYTDSFLVAKIKSYDNKIEYYILNRKKDSDSFPTKDVKIGPLNETEYMERWATRINVKLSKAQY
jgi:hypothetical protein